LTDKGRSDEAIVAYRRSLEINPFEEGALINLGNLLKDVNDFVDAEDCYRKALEIKSGNALLHVNLGNVLVELERFEESVSSYHEALGLNPNLAEAYTGLGNAFKKMGRLEDAIASYHQVLILKPNHGWAFISLGNVLKEQGKMEEACDKYQKAIAIKPDFAEAHYYLGITFKELGKLGDAIASYHRVLTIKPDHVKAFINLGNVLKEQGKVEEACDKYQKAIAIKPDFAEAHYNLGNTFNDLGHLEDAIASYHKALAIKSDYLEVYNNLGIVFNDLGRLEDSITSYHKALAIKPDYVEAQSNLGRALKDLGHFDEAIESFHKAIAIKPDFAEAHRNLGNMLQEQGNVDGAAQQFDLALSFKPEKDGWRIRKALLFPIIPHSLDDIRTCRENLGTAVKALQKQNLTVEDPTVDIGVTNFYLAYNGQNNKNILQDISKMHIAACPKLTYEAKHCRSTKDDQKGRLRIGFLSSYFWKHTVGKLSRGIIEHFSRDLFEVIVFRLPGNTDEMSDAIDHTADKVVQLRKKLDRDWRIIAEEELDILFYPDIGMDPYTYFLSFARLAPVQAVSWGHPDTTGIPNIDYFISSDLLEHPDSAGQYTEQLVQLSTLPTYYFRPELPGETFDRADFGLPEKCRIYVCPQTLFKLHPKFDKVLGELLRRDPDGRLVLIDDGKGGHLNKLFMERLGRSCAEIVDRVIFVPQMSSEKFLGLLILADALLDVPTFSGGNSSLEAFAMATPIVTWPGNFMRSRVTAVFYKQMGLNELVASDVDTYVSLALKLAQDANFRSRMQADIKANSHKLYEREDVVRELGSFSFQAYKFSQKG